MSALALALVLLPGLLVVRAPWTAVAPLSLASWTLLAWWPPFASAGRSRVVTAALVAFGLLALLRLVPRHEAAPPPGWREAPRALPPARPGLASPPLRSTPSLLVLGAALALFAAAARGPHAPGPRLAFQTTAARLVVWRDGVPASFEPLLPLEPWGAHAPALATLAADVSLLTGADAARALVALAAAALALALVSLFALLGVRVEPLPAAAGALAAFALAPWPLGLSLFGTCEALLALGFALQAAALVAGHASRASAAAAALLLAAAALAQPLVAALTGGALAAASAGVRGADGGADGRGRGRRVAGVLALSLALAAPGLLPLAKALSANEARAIQGGVSTGELLAFIACVALAAALPRVLARPTRATRFARLALLVLGPPLVALRAHGWLASGVLPEPARAALARAAAITSPLSTVCAADGVREFVPALAGRRPGEPGIWIPAVHAEEWTRRERVACDVTLADLEKAASQPLTPGGETPALPPRRRE